MSLVLYECLLSCARNKSKTTQYQNEIINRQENEKKERNKAMK